MASCRRGLSDVVQARAVTMGLTWKGLLLAYAAHAFCQWSRFGCFEAAVWFMARSHSLNEVYCDLLVFKQNLRSQHY